MESDWKEQTGSSDWVRTEVVIGSGLGVRVVSEDRYLSFTDDGDDDGNNVGVGPDARIGAMS